MKKQICIAMMVLLASFALASEAHAQRGGGRGVGGGVGVGRPGVGVGRPGVGVGVGRPGWGWGWGVGWYGRGYIGPNGRYYSQPGYYGADNTGNGDRYSYYAAPEDPQDRVRLRLVVPNPDAEVWIAGDPTQQRGTTRIFESPSLDPGSYTYTVRARWIDNDQIVDQTRNVQVHPGDSVTVDFRPPREERLPAPGKVQSPVRD